MDKIKGYYIFAPGDPSVGIFPSEFRIEGSFIFDDEIEKDIFEEALCDFFTSHVVGERVHVMTYEEHERQIQLELQEEKMLDDSLSANDKPASIEQVRKAIIKLKLLRSHTKDKDRIIDINSIIKILNP